MYVLNVEDAKDVTQDVFISVLEKFSDFRNEAEIGTWIYRIAVNKCLDFLRKKNRKALFLSVFQLFILDKTKSQNTMHPGIQLEHKEQLENLLSIIHKLPENQKNVILLSKWEQLSQKEIAAILKLSEKAVESLFQRAKANIKKQLDYEQ